MSFRIMRGSNLQIINLNPYRFMDHRALAIILSAICLNIYFYIIISNWLYRMQDLSDLPASHVSSCHYCFLSRSWNCYIICKTLKDLYTVELHKIISQRSHATEAIYHFARQQMLQNLANISPVAVSFVILLFTERLSYYWQQLASHCVDTSFNFCRTVTCVIYFAYDKAQIQWDEHIIDIELPLTWFVVTDIKLLN